MVDGGGGCLLLETGERGSELGLKLLLKSLLLLRLETNRRRRLIAGRSRRLIAVRSWLITILHSLRQVLIHQWPILILNLICIRIQLRYISLLIPLRLYKLLRLLVTLSHLFLGDLLSLAVMICYSLV